LSASGEPRRRRGGERVLKIEDLKHGDCRRAGADAAGERGYLLYCGAPVEPVRLVGRLPCPYCREHAALAYRPQVQRPVSRPVELRETVAAAGDGPAAREPTGELTY